MSADTGAREPQRFDPLVGEIIGIADNLGWPIERGEGVVFHFDGPNKRIVIEAALAAGVGVPPDADFVRALDLHKERIRRLQEALCECQHRDFFQADLHDELCPVYVVAEAQKREYEPRVLPAGVGVARPAEPGPSE